MEHRRKIKLDKIDKFFLNYGTSSDLPYVLFESQREEEFKENIWRSNSKQFPNFYTMHTITNYCIQVIKT